MENVLLYGKWLIFGASGWVTFLALRAVHVYFLNVRTRKQTPFERIRRLIDEQKALIDRMYYREDMEEHFRKAGKPLGLTSVTYRLYRDIAFIAAFAYVHIALLNGSYGSYPYKKVGLLIALYIATHLHPKFPVMKLLGWFKNQYTSKKNQEVFHLYQMICNDYEFEDEKDAQSVYSTLMEYRKYTHAIRPALDKCLRSYPLDRKKALELFAREIGTDEAVSLANILKEVVETSPAEARDLLDQNYAEFKTKRQEIHRKRMKNRGLIGYVITFSGLMMILVCFIMVYVLANRDLQQFLYSQ